MAVKNKKASRQRELRQRARRFEVHHREVVTSPQNSLHACYVCEDWDKGGMAAINLARTIAPGRVTMLSFLVDVWGMGLKDAWGECDIPVSEFEERIDRAREVIGAVSLPLGTARHLVYGGILRAKELGLRLPKRYERWTAVLGPLPDGQTPDMSLFGRDGKIVLCCNPRDLEARLVGTSPKNLLARPDVEFELVEDDFTLVDGKSDEFDDAIAEKESQLADAIRKWCFATGKSPHPLLDDVVSAMLEFQLQAAVFALDDGNAFAERSESEIDVQTRRMLEFLLASFPGEEAEMKIALDQIMGFYASPECRAFMIDWVEQDEQPKKKPKSPKKPKFLGLI